MIREIRPETLLVYSWLIWLIFYLLTPGKYLEIEPLFPAVGILVSYNVFFLLGLLLPKAQLHNKSKSVYHAPRKIQLLFSIIFFIGLLGVILRVMQRGSFELTLDISQNRRDTLDAGEGSGGYLSIIAALLYPFSFISFMVCYYFRQYFSRIIFFVSIIIGLYPLIDSILMGGRSVLFFQGIALVIIIQLRSNLFSSIYIKSFIRNLFLRINKFKIFLFRKNWIKPSRIFFLVTGILFLSLFFIIIQNDRSSSFGKELDWHKVLEITEEYKLLKYNDATSEKLIHSEDPLTYYSQLGIIHYVAHGPFEFIRWVNHVQNPWGIHYGKYQFYVFVKFFKMLGVNTGMDFKEMTKNTGRSGVFTTFWGPIFLDFGILGIFYAFLFGLFCKKIYLFSMKPSLLGLLMYPFLGASIFSTSIINSIVGQNMYYFPAIIFTVVLFKIINLKK